MNPGTHHNVRVSDESATFPVFNREPPAHSAEEIEDPQHIADRDPDELARAVSNERPDRLPALASGSAYLLRPGEEVEAMATGGHLRGPHIALNATGFVFVHGGVAQDCRGAKKLVWVDVEHRPIGYISRGDHFVVAVDRTGTVIARLDTSDSLSPMRPDCLQQLCDLAGAEFEEVTARDVEELLARRPELVPPQLEFEVDHPKEEDAREIAEGIGFFVPLSLVLGGVGMAAFASATPFGLPYRLLGGLGILAAAVIGVWSRSAWRKRRSLARHQEGPR